MGLRQFVGEDGAVSPVIGVVIMVAITVILAAVIGVFVLGVGSAITNDNPKVRLGFEFDGGGNGFTPTDQNDLVMITHDGGDDVKKAAVEIKIDGVAVSPTTGWPDAKVGAGDSLVLDEAAKGSDVLQSGAVVRVVWNDSDGGATATIGERTVP